MFLAETEAQLIHPHLDDHNEYLKGCGIIVDAYSFLSVVKKKRKRRRRKRIEGRNTLN